MEESFKRMGTKRMDLMQVHNLVDAATHAKTLRDWKEVARIRYWGITHHHSGAYGDVERFIKAERPDCRTNQRGQGWWHCCAADKIILQTGASCKSQKSEFRNCQTRPLGAIFHREHDLVGRLSILMAYFP